jgi:TPR repeat protein
VARPANAGWRAGALVCLALALALPVGAPVASANVFGKDATGQTTDVAACRAAAVAGDAQAQFELGRRYARGIGLPKDVSRARMWLEKAADDQAAARRELAELYAAGAFGKPDLKTAYLWHGLAAAPGERVPTAAQAAIAKRLTPTDVSALLLRLAAHLDPSPTPGAAGPTYDATGRQALGAGGSRWYLVAAESGSPEAQLRVGQGYHLGQGGFPRDKARAVQWYTKAAKGGQKAAQADLGRLLLESGDTRGGLDWLKRAAQSGEAAAMVALGRLYATGAHGLLRNYPESLKWYRMASARPGDHVPEVCRALGEFYDLGKGTPEDFAAAKRWFEQAEGLKPGAPAKRRADAYDAAAWHYIRARDGKSALRWLMLEAEADPQELNNLSSTLKSGLTIDGHVIIEKDVEAGVRVLRRGAEAGVVHCMVNLAHTYRQGTYTPIDLPEARRWYLKAAQAGERGAQLDLARMLINGQGGPKDVQEGLVWLERSVAQPFPWAAEYMGELYERGQVVPMDLDRARSLYEKAALQGSRGGMLALARLFETGRGVPQDDLAAYAWYYAATAFGRPGPEALPRLRAKLSPEQREAALATLEPLFKARPNLRRFIHENQP